MILWFLPCVSEYYLDEKWSFAFYFHHVTTLFVIYFSTFFILMDFSHCTIFAKTRYQKHRLYYNSTSSMLHSSRHSGLNSSPDHWKQHCRALVDKLKVWFIIPEITLNLLRIMGAIKWQNLLYGKKWFWLSSMQYANNLLEIVLEVKLFLKLLNSCTYFVSVFIFLHKSFSSFYISVFHRICFLCHRDYHLKYVTNFLNWI